MSSAKRPHEEEVTVKASALPFEATSANFAEFVASLQVGKPSEVCVDPVNRRDAYLRASKPVATALVNLHTSSAFFGSYIKFEIVAEEPDKVFARLYETAKFTAFGRKDQAASVFVGNIPFTADEDDLIEFLESLGIAGIRDVYFVYDTSKDRHRGFGFIDTTKETANKLIAMRATKFQNSTLSFNLDESGQHTSRQAASEEVKEHADLTVCIEGIPWDLTTPQLNAFIQSLNTGAPSTAYVSTDEVTGKSRGIGYLTTSKGIAEKLANITTAKLRGRQLRFDINYGIKSKLMAGAKFGALEPRTVPSSLLLVKCLHPSKVGNKELQATFPAATSARVLVNRDGSSKGVGFVEFASTEEATEAFEALNGTELHGKKLELHYTGTHSTSKMTKSGPGKRRKTGGGSVAE